MPAVQGLRALPWRRILGVAQIVVTRLSDDIPASDRRRLRELLGQSRGDPRTLTDAERREIVRILRQVDVAKLGREVTTLLAMARSGRLLKR